MNSLLLLNGSPRGARANSLKMLTRVAEGWTAAGGSEPRVLHLVKPDGFQAAVAAFGSADTVMIGMPLYTDSMPALVKEFIEALAEYVGRPGNPRLGFLVQSGFPEALHSRHLETYLEKLARRLGSPYAGTIIRGSGEALQAMPDNASNKLWAGLRTLGGELALAGSFRAETLRAVARTERYSPVKAAITRIAMRVPITQFYWNGQLKKNGAWDRRFAAPYAGGFKD